MKSWGSWPSCLRRSWQTAVAPGVIVDVATEVTEAVAEDQGDRVERRTMRRSGCPARNLGDWCSRWAASTLLHGGDSLYPCSVAFVGVHRAGLESQCLKQSVQTWNKQGAELGFFGLQGKIKSLEQIFLFSLPVKEYQIVESFLQSSLKDEVMKIMPVQKQTRAGQRTRFKVTLSCIFPAWHLYCCRDFSAG